MPSNISTDVSDKVKFTLDQATYYHVDIHRLHSLRFFWIDFYFVFIDHWECALFANMNKTNSVWSIKPKLRWIAVGVFLMQYNLITAWYYHKWTSKSITWCCSGITLYLPLNMSWWVEQLIKINILICLHTLYKNRSFKGKVVTLYNNQSINITVNQITKWYPPTHPHFILLNISLEIFYSGIILLHTPLLVVCCNYPFNC